MAYASRGRKPIERASKIAHVEILKNPEVRAYVSGCVLPSPPEEGVLQSLLSKREKVDSTGVSVVIAVDGGFTETFVREEYPSAQIAFFTFGPLLFQLADLRALDRKRFIAPEDLQKLKKIQRYTLVLPTKGVRMREEDSLSSTIRRTIFEFFTKKRGADEDQLITSLKWFLFRRWQSEPDDSLTVEITSCPNGCGYGPTRFKHGDSSRTECSSCGEPIYLTDTFRLHERIDERTGASGIVSYVMTMLEQLVLVHLIYNILQIKPPLLRQVLFIKDGPLAFFGLVAPLYRPMRELVEYLLSEPSGSSGPTLQLVGLEKSGAFVEHAASIQQHVPPDQFLIVGDDYIRKHIVPGGSQQSIYGQNTYYGQKVLFRAATGEMYVATIPGSRYKAEPTVSDLPHIHLLLGLIAELRCSMYDNALIPVALANKLVSLSDHPSQRILTTFVRQMDAEHR